MTPTASTSVTSDGAAVERIAAVLERRGVTTFDVRAFLLGYTVGRGWETIQRPGELERAVERWVDIGRAIAREKDLTPA